MKRKIQKSVIDIIHDFGICSAIWICLIFVDMSVWILFEILTDYYGRGFWNIIHPITKFLIILWILLIPYNIVCNFGNYQNYFRKFIYKFIEYWSDYADETEKVD